MHLRHIDIRNIRTAGEFQWECESTAGWHVILGDNGAGKSSVLRAIALALVGPDEAGALRQTWADWLRRDSAGGHVNINLVAHREWDRDSGTGRVLENWHPSAFLSLRRDVATNAVSIVTARDHTAYRNPERHIWGGRSGWFSAAYGPFRRFSGGDKDAEKLYYTNPRLARHLTVFGESIALSECLAWLQNLRFKALEARAGGDPTGGERGRLLARLMDFVNHRDLLPQGVRMTDVNSERVTFRDGNGFEIAVEELSDGFRSVLSLTFELIRQLVATYGGDDVFDRDDPTRVVVPGVVLIDEIDAHLHPQWQRRIGFWFTDCFPNLQFIVTTHSPLVCQAAERGSVYRLPRPGSGERGGFVAGAELQRLLYGNILEAYETESFGLVETRSRAGQAKLERLAELNARALEVDLTPAEAQEREALRAALPTEQGRTEAGDDPAA